MIPHYKSFDVKISDREFFLDGKTISSKTAEISFFDKEKNLIQSIDYGYYDAESIYSLIDTHSFLSLDYCYINSFSLADYRITKHFDKKQVIKIFGLSAKNSFWESNNTSDFSYAEFSEGDIDFENAHFAKGKVSFHASTFGDGNINFAYTLFKNGNIDFANTIFGKGTISFKNAILHDGTKDFQYADLGSGHVVFANTEFNNGDVSFINTNFNDGDVSFKIARFGLGAVDFRFAKFGEGNISFERTEFGDGAVNFSKVEFHAGKVSFNRSIFGKGDITFEASSQIAGKMNFLSTNFGIGDINFEKGEYENADVIFEKSTFDGGKISFYASKFNVLSLKSCHLDVYFDIRVMHCNFLDLSDTIVRDIIDITPYDFAVKINTLNFYGMRLIGRIYIDWTENDVNGLIHRQKDTTEKQKAEQFRILKQNFNVIGQYSYEDKAYVEFKRFEATDKLYNAEKGIFAKLQAKVSYFLQWLIFDKMGLYATEPSRVLFSVFVIYTGFALLDFSLTIAGLGNVATTIPAELSLNSTLEKSFYFSGVTFFTIGFGDYFPTGILRFTAVMEGFCGVFSMSYFVVAFVRKILR